VIVFLTRRCRRDAGTTSSRVQTLASKGIGQHRGPNRPARREPRGGSDARRRELAGPGVDVLPFELLEGMRNRLTRPSSQQRSWRFVGCR